MSLVVPKVRISSCDKAMPIIGMGAGRCTYLKESDREREILKAVYVEAMKAGYRHFDTASEYETEEILGEAIMEALIHGLIKSRDELFITSKLGPRSSQKDLVVPAIQMSLRKLQLDYLDLYLVHTPVRVSPEATSWPVPNDMIFPIDIKGVWEAMEECKSLGLTKAIGVSNFSCKKLEELLSIARIPPSVNQVEVNPRWQQKQLREFCKAKDIHITAYSPLGAYKDNWGHKAVIECDVLQEIANAKGKTTAQIALRWVYEQGVSLIPKTLKKERMKENLEIFDWCLTEEELNKINQLPQSKGAYIAKVTGASPDFILEIDKEL